MPVNYGDINPIRLQPKGPQPSKLLLSLLYPKPAKRKKK